MGANLVFACLCLVAVGLQYNDPDPIRWMLLYGGGAAATVAALHVDGGWRAAALVALVAAAWGLYWWSGVIGHVQATDLWRKMSEKGGKVEEYREAGGLTIVATWLAAMALVGRRHFAPRPAR